jgi:hypothetical protein
MAAPTQEQHGCTSAEARAAVETVKAWVQDEGFHQTHGAPSALQLSQTLPMYPSPLMCTSLGARCSATAGHAAQLQGIKDGLPCSEPQ